ncbi:MAG: hypothetical protein R3C10_27990 [Pirellulales bacterium]
MVTTPDGRKLNHGPLSVWYESGELRSEGQWRFGSKHGHFAYWHKNGQKAKEFTWHNGVGDGVFNQWDEAGTLLRSELWRDGHRTGSSTATVESTDADAENETANVNGSGPRFGHDSTAVSPSPASPDPS